MTITYPAGIFFLAILVFALGIYNIRNSVMKYFIYILTYSTNITEIFLGGFVIM